MVQSVSLLSAVMHEKMMIRWRGVMANRWVKLAPLVEVPRIWTPRLKVE